MDLTIISFAVSLLAIVVGMTVFSKQLVPVWGNRDLDFYSLKDKFNNFILVSAFAATTIMLTLWKNRASPVLLSDPEYGFVSPIPVYIIIVMTAITFYAALSAFTDILVFKAPQEIAHLAMMLVLPFAFLFAPEGGLISMAIFSVIPAILYFFPGIGLADIRFLWVISFGVSWWAGWYISLLLFGIAAFIQLIMHSLSRFTGLGQIRKIKPSPLKLLVRKIQKKLNPKAIIDLSGKPEPRMVTPLLPALAISYVLGLTILLILGSPVLFFNSGLGLSF